MTARLSLSEVEAAYVIIALRIWLGIRSYPWRGHDREIAAAIMVRLAAIVLT